MSEVPTSWHSYASIFNLGHGALRGLNEVTVYVEEKVDGSQFSFGVFDGEVKCRSKNNQLIVDAPDKMFGKAVEAVLARKDLLHDGWTYRGEYLSRPKHNALTYGRTPQDNIIIFDVNTAQETYMSWDEKNREAGRINLECVPLLYEGLLDYDKLKALLDTDSVLGGQKIEGVVIKQNPVQLYAKDGKALIAKFVSEAFKEVHASNWKISNPKQGDILEVLGASLATEARWRKAAQHLREAGRLEDSPRDIGLLIKEIPDDILSDSEGQLKQALWDWAWPRLRRKSVGGVAEWYKQQLLEKQFEPTHTSETVAELDLDNERFEGHPCAECPHDLGAEIDNEPDVTG